MVFESVIWNHAEKDKTKELHFSTKRVRPIFDIFCNSLQENANVLDIGCGNGIITKELIERGFNVIGIDISKKCITEARKNTPDAQFIRISMSSIPFESKFHGALASYSMHLVDKSTFDETAKNIFRALKKDGLFFLILAEPMRLIKYSVTEIINLFEKQGMKIIISERESFRISEHKEYATLIFLMQKIS